MGIVPKDKGKRIAWYKVRLPQWAQDPLGIGSTPEDVAALAAVLEEARLARVEQRAAQQAARTATQRVHQAMERLSVHGSAVILQIRSKARGDGDPAIFVRASMPQPRKKRRLPGPGTPYGFKFHLEQVGWLTLSWKCDHPANGAGPMYAVWRQLNGVGPFELLGYVGKKKWVDKTLPAGGAAGVTYRVRARRAEAVGEVAHYQIALGTVRATAA